MKKDLYKFFVWAILVLSFMGIINFFPDLLHSYNSTTISIILFLVGFGFSFLSEYIVNKFYKK